MRLNLNAYQALQEYKKYVEMCAHAFEAAGREESTRIEMLTLERFAIWLEEEWPRFTEAVK